MTLTLQDRFPVTDFQRLCRCFPVVVVLVLMKSFEDVGGCVFVLLVDFIDESVELDIFMVLLQGMAEFKIQSVVGKSSVKKFICRKFQWLMGRRVVGHVGRRGNPIQVRFVCNYFNYQELRELLMFSFGDALGLCVFGCSLVDFNAKFVHEFV